jgi:hypothetical protein
MDPIPSARLYGAAIAIVSGVYSLVAGGGGMGMSMMAADWIMLVIGVVVVIHGVVLLTPLAANLGGISGPLMILWSLIMLGNQLVGMTGVDGGMIAIAVLMLVSGLIMTLRR